MLSSITCTFVSVFFWAAVQEWVRFPHWMSAKAAANVPSAWMYTRFTRVRACRVISVVQLLHLGSAHGELLTKSLCLLQDDKFPVSSAATSQFFDRAFGISSHSSLASPCHLKNKVHPCSRNMPSSKIVTPIAAGYQPWTINKRDDNTGSKLSLRNGFARMRSRYTFASCPPTPTFSHCQTPVCCATAL